MSRWVHGTLARGQITNVTAVSPCVRCFILKRRRARCLRCSRMEVESRWLRKTLPGERKKKQTKKNMNATGVSSCVRCLIKEKTSKVFEVHGGWTNTDN